MAGHTQAYPLLMLAALMAGGARAEASVDAAAAGDPETPVLYVEGREEIREALPAAAGATGGGGGNPWRGGEFYAGVFGGNVSAADAVVRGTYQCYFCAPVSDQANIHPNGGGAFGVRAGFWGGEGAVNPGIAFEASGAGVSGDQVSLHYQGFGFAPMVRMRLLRSAAQPQGRLAPYAGFLLFRLNGGNLEVNLPALPRPLSGTPTGMANGALLGLAMRLGTFEVAAEARKVNVDVSLDSMAGDKAEFRTDCTQLLLVIDYRFSN